MKKFFILLIAIISSFIGNAQTTNKNLSPVNVFYVQGLGNAVYGSIGYQFNFNKLLAVSIGGFAIPIKKNSFEAFTVGVLLNSWCNKKNCFLSFETGFGYYKLGSSTAILNANSSDVIRGRSEHARSLYFQPSFSIKLSSHYYISIEATRFLVLNQNDSWNMIEKDDKRMFGSFKNYGGIRLNYIINY